MTPTGKWVLEDLEKQCDDAMGSAEYLDIYCANATALCRDVRRLQKAATALYEAAHWTADRPVDDVALWTELRDALGREPGGAPKPK